jgi:hypothetical protein
MKNIAIFILIFLQFAGKAQDTIPSYRIISNEGIIQFEETKWIMIRDSFAAVEVDTLIFAGADNPPSSNITLKNVGIGEGIFKGISNGDYELRTISAGDGQIVREVDDIILIKPDSAVYATKNYVNQNLGSGGSNEQYIYGFNQEFPQNTSHLSSQLWAPDSLYLEVGVYYFDGELLIFYMGTGSTSARTGFLYNTLEVEDIYYSTTGIKLNPNTLSNTQVHRANRTDIELDYNATATNTGNNSITLTVRGMLEVTEPGYLIPIWRFTGNNGSGVCKVSSYFKIKRLN